MTINNNQVPDKLRELRFILGLSQKQIADKIGVSIHSVIKCETWNITGKRSPNFAKIKDYLETVNLEALVREKQKARYLSFIQGHSYIITASPRKKIKPIMGIVDGPCWDRDYVFIYLRKDGKHHVFKEARGGWTRTYTDAQLVGKKILEVT